MMQSCSITLRESCKKHAVKYNFFLGGEGQETAKYIRLALQRAEIVKIGRAKMFSQRCNYIVCPPPRKRLSGARKVRVIMF